MGNKNKCKVIHIEGTSLSYGESMTFDDRSGTYAASPCKLSRLGAGQAAVCCPTSSWWGKRYVECKITEYSGTALTLVSEWWGDGVTVAEVNWPESVAANAMLQLSDSDNGHALICHEKKQQA